jgi:hypothetical protein
VALPITVGAAQSQVLSTLLNRVLTGIYTAAGVRVADVAGAFATDDAGYAVIAEAFRAGTR